MISNILYIGSNKFGSTSLHRADALKRLGHNVKVVDPRELIGRSSKLQEKINWLTGYRFIQKKLMVQLKSRISQLNRKSTSLIWVDSGELIGQQTLKFLANSFSCPIILFNVDDPFGSRDFGRFWSLTNAIYFYDFCFFVRWETVLDAQALGIQNSYLVSRSYDEKQHQSSKQFVAKGAGKFVSFIGTFIPNEGRDKFLRTIISKDIPLRICGNSWQKSSIYKDIGNHCNNQALAGLEYSQAISTASVSLGLLSHGNRDLVTQRSFEAPACKGLFCAERTSEHQLLYEDGVEALFWDNAEECAQKCKAALSDSGHNEAIRLSGHKRVHEIGVGNEDICRQILATIGYG